MKGLVSVQIIKKINTSAAIALDSAGQEIVVLGKGIGFPEVPYELTDLSKVERTFYDVNSRYFGIIENLPNSILTASAEIVEMAKFELQAELNPNLPFTLADHLNFAVERLKKGVDLTNAIAYDVRNYYPVEIELGMKSLEIMKERANITLPESEAVNIAMHLINAEAKKDDLPFVFKTTKIFSEIEKIVETNLAMTLDRESYEYSRFITHLRYLIQRLSIGKNIKGKNEMMLSILAENYPKIYKCAKEIVNYLEGTWNFTCTEDEILYLMLHINRVKL